MYQNAWSVYLRDHVASKGQSSKGKEQTEKEIHWGCNKGRCTFGQGCRFDHRCSHCNKSGHPVGSYHKRKNKAKRKEKNRESKESS